MARWRVTPFTVADDDRADEGFDYEVRFDAEQDRWFVYHGQKLAGVIKPENGSWLYSVWALPFPGAPAERLVEADYADTLFEAIEAIHAHIGRCDAEREAAEALAEDDDEVEE